MEGGGSEQGKVRRSSSRDFRAANDNKTRGDHATRREPLNSKFDMLLTARSGAFMREKEEYVGWKVVWVARRRFVENIVQCMHTLKAGGSVQTAQTNGKGSELTSG